MYDIVWYCLILYIVLYIFISYIVLYILISYIVLYTIYSHWNKNRTWQQRSHELRFWESITGNGKISLLKPSHQWWIYGIGKAKDAERHRFLGISLSVAIACVKESPSALLSPCVNISHSWTISTLNLTITHTFTHCCSMFDNTTTIKRRLDEAIRPVWILRHSRLLNL